MLNFNLLSDRIVFHNKNRASQPMFTKLPNYSDNKCHVSQLSAAMMSWVWWCAVVPEPRGPGGPLAPPIFGRSVNPIPTGGGQIIPTTYYWPPKVFHLPASLHVMQNWINRIGLSRNQISRGPTYFTLPWKPFSRYNGARSFHVPLWKFGFEFWTEFFQNS